MGTAVWYILDGSRNGPVSLVATDSSGGAKPIRDFSSRAEALAYASLAGVDVENARLTPVESWEPTKGAVGSQAH